MHVLEDEACWWLVVRVSVHPPLPRLGLALSETEVCLAFALGAGTGAAAGEDATASGLPFVLAACDDSALPPPQQPVYAWLPLRRCVWGGEEENLAMTL